HRPEDAPRVASGREEIFRDGFEPVHARVRRQHFAVMDGPKADAVAEVRKSRHAGYFCFGFGGFGSGMAVPPFSLHSFSVKETKPWPLQPFFPLQSFLADLQSDCPLHALRPWQWTFFSVCAATWTDAAVAKRPATSVAIAVPFVMIVL